MEEGVRDGEEIERLKAEKNCDACLRDPEVRKFLDTQERDRARIQELEALVNKQAGEMVRVSSEAAQMREALEKCAQSTDWRHSADALKLLIPIDGAGERLLERLRKLERVAEAARAIQSEIYDAACSIQCMKDGYDDDEHPFDRLRALRHSFFGNRDAGLALKAALAALGEGKYAR
jgi:hypothetical protein